MFEQSPSPGEIQLDLVMERKMSFLTPMLSVISVRPLAKHVSLFKQKTGPSHFVANIGQSALLKEGTHFKVISIHNTFTFRRDSSMHYLSTSHIDLCILWRARFILS